MRLERSKAKPKCCCGAGVAGRVERSQPRRGSTSSARWPRDVLEDPVAAAARAPDARSITATEGRSRSGAMASSRRVRCDRAGLDIVAADGLDRPGRHVLADLERWTSRRSGATARPPDSPTSRARAAPPRVRVLNWPSPATCRARIEEAVDARERSRSPSCETATTGGSRLYALLIKARASDRSGTSTSPARSRRACWAGRGDQGRWTYRAGGVGHGRRVDTLLGRYPEALELRAARRSHLPAPGRSDVAAVHARQPRRAAHPSRPARGGGSRALSEVEAGAARGLEAYTGRARRVASLRACSRQRRRFGARTRCASRPLPGRIARTPTDSTSLLAVGHRRPAARTGAPAAIPGQAAKSGADPAQVADRQSGFRPRRCWLGDAAARPARRAGRARATPGHSERRACGGGWRPSHWSAARTVRRRRTGGADATGVSDAFETTPGRVGAALSTRTVSRADLVDLRKRTAMASLTAEGI